MELAASASKNPKGVKERWRPEPVPDGWELVWEAWGELNTCRHYTMGGAGPIPWTAIAQYCGGPPSGEFLYVIRYLDKVFLGHQADRSKSKKRKPKGAK